jgi:hypothetical protein
MPYIDNKTKSKLFIAGDDTALMWWEVEAAGELNFSFTYIIDEYVGNKGLNYQIINDILGALDGASKEFYERVAIPYEKKKRLLNGEVYKKSLKLLKKVK